MQLYNLLPEIIRYKDKNTSATEDTILKNIFYALESDTSDLQNLISGLSDLFNIKTCPEEYLPYLSRFLGSNWPSSWSLVRRRLFLQSIVLLYHNSGQRLSWEVLLNFLGYSGFFPKELWKQDIYEDFDYCIDSGDDYYCLYHAARVDIRNQSDIWKTLLADEEQYFESFRPIHVLFRKEGDSINHTNDTTTKLSTDSNQFTPSFFCSEEILKPSDVCSRTCEVACEAVCEAGSCEGMIEITITCELTCEINCESTVEI